MLFLKNKSETFLEEKYEEKSFRSSSPFTADITRQRRYLYWLFKDEKIFYAVGAVCLSFSSIYWFLISRQL